MDKYSKINRNLTNIKQPQPTNIMPCLDDFKISSAEKMLLALNCKHFLSVFSSLSKILMILRDSTGISFESNCTLNIRTLSKLEYILYRTKSNGRKAHFRFMNDSNVRNNVVVFEINNRAYNKRKCACKSS
jgi:hypothetical protein